MGKFPFYVPPLESSPFGQELTSQSDRFQKPSAQMPTLPVQITRFIDEHQPGFVEFAFEDADGVACVFIDKVPVVTRDNLGATSLYPCAGTIACEIVETWTDAVGRSLVRIDTERPWHIETASGETQFVVLAERVRV